MKTTNVRESDVESYFVLECKYRRLWAIKIFPINIRGFPDRMVLGANRLIFFVELKRPQGKLRKLQEFMANRLRNFGFDVFTLDTKEKVSEFFDQKEYLRT